jgi:hypothetical protein
MRLAIMLGTDANVLSLKKGLAKFAEPPVFLAAGARYKPYTSRRGSSTNKHIR